MSTNQTLRVTHAAQVSHTFLSLPVYVQVRVVSYVGQITEIFIRTIHHKIGPHLDFQALLSLIVLQSLLPSAANHWVLLLTPVFVTQLF